MNKILSDHDRAQLDGLITETEKRTNTQIVLAVIKRSDSYAEIPWKAFAMGASITGLLLFIGNLFVSYWIVQSSVMIAIAATLFAGVVFALLTVFVPTFAKAFLSNSRSTVEVQQYAESLFLKRELFATSKRRGILVLISLFERRVIVLPDKGLNNQLTEAEMQKIIAPMLSSLKRNDVKSAFEEGLKHLSAVPGLAEPLDNFKNELPNNIIEEDKL